jgi:hypothetical protein
MVLISVWKRWAILRANVAEAISASTSEVPIHVTVFIFRSGERRVKGERTEFTTLDLSPFSGRGASQRNAIY